MKRAAAALFALLALFVVAAAAPPPDERATTASNDGTCAAVAPPGTSYRAPGGDSPAAISQVATVVNPTSAAAAMTTSDAAYTLWVASDAPDGGKVEVFGNDAWSGQWRHRSTIPVGRNPVFITRDAVEYNSNAAANFFVANAGSCSVSVIDAGSGGSDPQVVKTLDLGTSPGQIAWDYQALFVAEPALDRIAMFDAERNPAGTFAAGTNPYDLVALPDGRLWVANTGRDGSGGSVQVFDARQRPPKLLASIPASGPRLGGLGWFVYVMENGANRLSMVRYDDAAGAIRQSAPVTLDPSFDPSRPSYGTAAIPFGVSVNTDGSTSSSLLFVTLDGSDHMAVFTLDRDGAPAPGGAIYGIYNAISAESVVVERGGRVLTLDPEKIASYITKGAPPLASVLPGPLDVSWAPQDVGRSFGIVVLIMLLLGAPTPVFNGTLAANRQLIERWLRRRRPKAVRGAGRTLGPIGRALVALAHTWPGLVAYLLGASLLYAFLDPAFPAGNGAVVVFAVTLIGIAAGTAISQLPAELYVRRHYADRGRVRVGLWTLILAAACVFMTRLTAVQPGYVYGIIGGFAFSVALTTEDKGRMAFNGMAFLIATGFAAWFLRIPFQPNAALGGGPGATVNDVLAGLFVNAVEGAAIGLIPLRFLAGEPLWQWSRARWAVLWGGGLFLFAHVILYPVSSYEPNPSAVGVWTIAATAALYGAIAVGFWWFFRRRAVRRRSEPKPLPAGT